MTREEQAFLAGFRCSGEGWNGEWPYEGKDDEAVWADIKDEFERWTAGTPS